MNGGCLSGQGPRAPARCSHQGAPRGACHRSRAARRFEQEARSASALNHPNIITIYEIRLRQGYGGQVGKHESISYIAMELVEGKTLREMLSGSPLLAKKMLPVASQIAEGLAKAHSAGIVHRDLKPENIMITRDGFVKILDFGLAKLFTPFSDADSDMATMEKGGTSPGVIMGTAGYMSPEQAKGQAVDFRADQFAFGAILYEMVTGKRAFQRETGAETISAVLRDEPQPLSETHPNLSPHLRVIVERCLAKDAEERYAATLDLARDLKSMGEPSTVTADKPRRKPRRLAIAAALIAVLAIAVGLNVGGLRERLLRGKKATKIESIAVLPLDNLSGDPAQEYFADGMTETLITELSKIGALKVISRTSVMRFKDTNKSLPEIARELNVDAVVEGSVLRAGDRVRITAQLVHAGTDQHLWADNFDRDLEDILNLHSEVARAIAEEVKIQLTPQEESLLAADRPVNPEAHEAHLMGLYHWGKRTPEGFSKAIDYFNQAIETDPNFAPAYAALSNLYVTYTYLDYDRPRNIIPEARTAALKALELDEHLAEAHTALGQILFYFDWNWSGAEREFKRALELNPGSAYGHYAYGNYLSVGRMAESVVEHHRALELDPLSIPMNWIVAVDYLRLRRYDDAIERMKKIIDSEPDNTPALWSLSAAYYFKAMYEESVAARKRILESRGDAEAVEALESGYERSGFAGAMRSTADKLVDQREKRYIQAAHIAELYAYADDKEKAVQLLERSFEEREPHLIHVLKWGIVHDRLQSDPRFQDIVRRMNFPE